MMVTPELIENYGGVQLDRVDRTPYQPAESKERSSLS
jgi:hypothetical protein